MVLCDLWWLWIKNYSFVFILEAEKTAMLRREKLDLIRKFVKASSRAQTPDITQKICETTASNDRRPVSDSPPKWKIVEATSEEVKSVFDEKPSVNMMANENVTNRLKLWLTYHGYPKIDPQRWGRGAKGANVRGPKFSAGLSVWRRGGRHFISL